MSGAPLAAIVALLLAGPAMAQPHEHGASGLHLLSDLGPSGVTFVGALNHFTLLALGDDDEPDFHQDLPLRITLDGDVVLGLDADAGHDYDGVREAWVVFGRPGHYRVEALDEEGDVLASLEGSVLAYDPAAIVGAGLDGGWDGLPVLLGRSHGNFDLRINGKSTTRDVLLDFRSEGRLVLSQQSRAVEGKLSFAGSAAGTGAQSLDLTIFDADPVHQAQPIPAWTVSDPVAWPSSVLGWPASDAALGPPPEAANAVARSADGPLRLVGTYDPWTSVGPDTLQTIAFLAFEGNQPAANVTFDARLVSTYGRLHWQSGSGFAPAGIWSLSTVQPQPGLYRLDVVARSSAGSATLSVPWMVKPPIEPDSVGPVAIVAEGLDGAVAGHPSQILLKAQDMRGTPFAHTDIVVDVVGPSWNMTDVGGGVGTALVLRTKIHSHADGTFALAFAPPLPGSYELRLTPSPLEARPITFATYVLPFEVEAPIPQDTAHPTPTPGPAAPGVPTALVALAFLVLAALLGRHPPPPRHESRPRLI